MAEHSGEFQNQNQEDRQMIRLPSAALPKRPGNLPTRKALA